MRTPPIDAAAVSEAWERSYAGTQAESPLVIGIDGVARDASDARAAMQKWYRRGAGASYSVGEQAWYLVFERARVETLASLELPGMAANLQHIDAISPAPPAAAHLYRVARTLFAGEKIEQTIEDVLPDMASTPRHTEKKTSTWRRLVRLGRPLDRETGASPEGIRAEAFALTEQNARDILEKASALVAESGQFASTIAPLIQALARHMPIVPVKMLDVKKPASGADMPVVDPLSDIDKEDAESTSPGSIESETERPDWPGYNIFSTQWDELRSSASFFGNGATPTLTGLSDPRREHVRRLAHRLQRRLLAARLPTWAFEQEEGRIDNRRLSRLLVPGPRATAVFRQEQAAPMPEACVTLLVDQSGSMDSKRREMVALAIDLAVHTLESCRISVEVLGFTTRFDADSPVVEAWQAAACPASPGRLNALRHIVYKTANRPWRRCRPYLELLLRDGLGKENIDGESLDWAARRLAGRREARKILIVLSDGSPYDAATTRVHGRAYLEDHLRQVIAAIEASPIHLVGIGAAHSVSRFYRSALILPRPDDVAQVLFEQLGELLTHPKLKA